MREIVQPVGSMAGIYGPRIAAAVLVFLFFALAAETLAWGLRRLARRMTEHRALLRGLRQGGRFLLYLIGSVSALGAFGVDVTAMVASLGLVGFALGFALKDSVSNFLAGLLILFYRPFRVGDLLQVSGQEGVVVSVDLRYTTLEQGDRRILIPNANLFSNVVVVKSPPEVT